MLLLFYKFILKNRKLNKKKSLFIKNLAYYEIKKHKQISYKRKCLVSKNVEHGHYSMYNLTRYRLREYQALGLLNLIKK